MLMSVYKYMPHAHWSTPTPAEAKTPRVQPLRRRTRNKHRAKQSYLSAPFPFWFTSPTPILAKRRGERKDTAHHHALLDKYDIKAYVLQHTDPCTNVARCNTVRRERGEGRGREREKLKRMPLPSEGRRAPPILPCQSYSVQEFAGRM